MATSSSELTLDSPIKFLAAGHCGPFSEFDYTPYLPKDGEPGKWLTVHGRLDVCRNGIHYKWVARRVRLMRQLPWGVRAARLFACDCAEHVLPLYERRHPNDRRVADCIAITRRFVNGEVPLTVLRNGRAAVAAAAAAADAAADADAAAYAAARTAERQWQSGQLLRYLRGELP